MIWEFTNWSTGSSNNIVYIDANVNKDVVANHIGYPQVVTGFNFYGSVGQNIKFRWTRHANSNVTYKIYRKVKNVQGPTLLATLNNNVLEYEDTQYQKTAGYTDDLLYYDARAYYNPDANSASENWHAVYGESGARIAQQDNQMVIGAIPNEFSLNNYPNPFNPATTIQYSLPERSIVNLSIYNLNGKKVREWEIGETSAGIRNITWDGNDHFGNRVPAGVYIYKLNAIAVNSGKYYSDKKKMIFMK